MAQDLLPLTGGEMTARTALAAISPSLAKLLMVTANDAAEAVQLAGYHPALVQEARDKLPLVTRLAAPAGMGQVLRCVAELLLHFDPPSFGEGKPGAQLADAWQSSYAKALEDLPVEALEIAVAGWIKCGKTFPKVAHLRDLAEPKTKELRVLSWRIKQVAEKARLPKPPPTAEERAEVKRMMEDLAANLKLKAADSKWPGPMNRQRQHEVAERLRAQA